MSILVMPKNETCYKFEVFVGRVDRWFWKNPVLGELKKSKLTKIWNFICRTSTLFFLFSQHEKCNEMHEESKWLRDWTRLIVVPKLYLLSDIIINL